MLLKFCWLTQTMATMMSPPPAATCLAFYPEDNNIVAIGMDDATILIYNVRTNKVLFVVLWTCRVAFLHEVKPLHFWVAIILQVKATLVGHTERVTGLAFSQTLNVLISSGPDVQVSTCFFVTYDAITISSLPHPSKPN